MTVKVKICGITREEDIDVVVEAGADAVGFIVGIPSSPRNLTIGRALQLMERVPPFVNSVVVTHSDKMVSTYNRLRSSHLQIIGDDPDPQILSQLHRTAKIIKVLPISSPTISRRRLRSYRMYDAILVDSHVKGQLGGTGRTHDWRVSREIKELISPQPLILAGGLTEFNVAQAIREVRPYAVDVSSGVESRPGIKDYDKVRRFIKAAKEAE